MTNPIVNYLGVSGGKDSTALLLWATRESGYDPASLHVRSGGAYPVVSGTLDEPVSGDKYDADRGDKARAANAWAMAATDDTERVVDRIALNQVLAQLSERDRHILLAHIAGRNQEEIAAEYNVSRSLVSMWIPRAIERARKIASRFDFD